MYERSIYMVSKPSSYSGTLNVCFKYGHDDEKK